MDTTTPQNTNDRQEEIILGIDNECEWPKYVNALGDPFPYMVSKTLEAWEVIKDGSYSVRAIVIQGESESFRRFDDTTEVFFHELLLRDFRGPLIVLYDEQTRIDSKMLMSLSPQIKMAYKEDFFRLNGSDVLDCYSMPSAREIIERHAKGWSKDAAEWLTRLEALVQSFKFDIHTVYRALDQTGVGQRTDKRSDGWWFYEYRGLVNLAVRQSFYDHPENLASMRRYLGANGGDDPRFELSPYPFARKNGRLLQILSEEPYWKESFIWPV